VLRSPFSDPSPTPTSNTGTSTAAPAPAYLKELFSDAKTSNPNAPQMRHLANPDDTQDINTDLKATPASGA